MDKHPKMWRQYITIAVRVKHYFYFFGVAYDILVAEGVTAELGQGWISLPTCALP